MHNKVLTALFSLKYNPFLPAIPPEDLWIPPDLEPFLWRLKNLIDVGGFALVGGEPGVGKSKTVHCIAHHLQEKQSDELVVGVVQRPQSTLGDFYRELGTLFGLNLSVANRYGGFEALRKRWVNHFSSTLLRPVLLIDECQEMHTCCLNELRLLTSAHFDSRCLLTVVLCGDMRLAERFRDPALLALGSRIRLRLNLIPADRQTSIDFLEHILAAAGAPHLMTSPVKEALVEHATGNFRMLTTMAAQLLEEAVHRQMHQIDEQLFVELFARAAKAQQSQRRQRSAVR